MYLKLLFLVLIFTFVGVSCAVLEDQNLTIHELAEKYGYELEAHTVITEDGYILTLHRLLSKRRRKRKLANSKVVFLSGGLCDIGASWMVQGPNKSLAYILVDNGYDVWMGNARGSNYSLSHVTLKSNTAEFWDFDWEEMGLYDLPANIDYIISETGVKRIFFVGYSVGTSSYFVMCSMRPEYNDKIKLMISIGTAVFKSHSKLATFNNLPMLYLLHNILLDTKMFTFSSLVNKDISPVVCKVIPKLCRDAMTVINGPHNITDETWPVVLTYMPSGATPLQLIHYGQMIQSKRFCRFDYGTRGNIAKYGRPTPPDYNLAAVTSPVFVVYSSEDMFTVNRDVEITMEHLPNVVGSYDVGNYSHLDFMYAESASVVLYPLIIEQFENIEEEFNLIT